MGKILNLPQPIDAEGQVLSAEEIDAIASEPTYFPVELEINGRKVTFTGACDFDQVDDKADQAYQLFKNELHKIYAERKTAKKVNSKLTNQKSDVEEEKETDELTPEQSRKIIELKPKERKILLDILFPPNFETDPVFLGGNIPGMPDSLVKIREWLSRNGKTQVAVLEAAVMVYDPTGPLALGKKSAELQERMSREIEATVMEKLEGLKNLDLTQLASSAESKSSNDKPGTETPASGPTVVAPTSQEKESSKTQNSPEPLPVAGGTDSSEVTGTIETPAGP